MTCIGQHNYDEDYYCVDCGVDMFEEDARVVKGMVAGLSAVPDGALAKALRIHEEDKAIANHEARATQPR